jgi:hypothetical protein
VRLMSGFFVCSLVHATSVRDDATASAKVADVLSRPCFAALKRAAVRTGDRDTKHREPSAEVIRSILAEPKAHALVMDSGRAGDLTALAVVEVGLPYKPDDGFPAPLKTYVIVPFDAGTEGDMVDACCDLAEAVQVVYGVVSVEPSFGIAQTMALAGRLPEDQRATYSLISDERLRYRRASWQHDKSIDIGIGGPEWGTFLGPKHVEKLSVPDLRASGAFAEVRELPHGGVFLQLSRHPGDAQAAEINELVAVGRRGLEPILLNVDGVRI